jgi:hypothetical protein
MGFDLLDTRGKWLGSYSATSLGELRRATPRDLAALVAFWDEGITLDLRAVRLDLREWIARLRSQGEPPSPIEALLIAARRARGAFYISEGEPDARGTHPGLDEKHRPTAWAVERRRLSCYCGVLVRREGRWRERSRR